MHNIVPLPTRTLRYEYTKNAWRKPGSLARLAVSLALRPPVRSAQARVISGTNSRLGRGRRDHCFVKLNAAMFPHER